MIVVLACLCGGSERIARRVLRNAGYAKWSTHPVHRGKTECNEVLNQLEARGFNTEEVRSYIGLQSSFVVIVGYSANSMPKLHYVDVGTMKTEDGLRGETIVEHFA